MKDSFGYVLMGYEFDDLLELCDHYGFKIEVNNRWMVVSNSACDFSINTEASAAGFRFCCREIQVYMNSSPAKELE